MVRIRVNSVVNNTPYAREFVSYKTMLNTAYFEGEFLPWWGDSEIQFEEHDGFTHSAAMVEIINGRTLTVGRPSYYRTWHFKSYKGALEIGDKVSQDWLNWDNKDKWQEFVSQVEVPVNLTMG